MNAPARRTERITELDLGTMFYKDTSGTCCPTHKQIEEFAYAFYLLRGKEPGHDLDDWLAAEKELRRHLA